MKLTLTATCLFGLESLLGEEIDALGFRRIETMDGRVTFEGDEQAVATANVCLRFAERVYIELGRYPATTFEELFEGAFALPWELFVRKNDAFPVKGHCVHSVLTSVPACQSILKKALAKRLGREWGLTRLPETGTVYQVVFFLFKDVARLMIDTSGDPLYKRGYRQETGEAPLRETLAAAMVRLSRPRENVLLWDPMCGSGTIAVEGAMMMRRIAPGRARHFAGETFPALPPSVWTLAKEAAFDEEVKSDFEVYASDIDPAMAEIAAENVRRAGVGDNVRCFVADARSISAPGRRGTIVTNPPYGERLGTVEEAQKLYAELGEHFRALAPWQIYILAADPAFERFYGKRADKVRRLYNGMIPCTFYQYFKNGSQRPARG